MHCWIDTQVTPVLMCSLRELGTAVQEPAKTLLEKHQESIKLDNANRKRQRKEARNKAESGVAEAKEKHPDWAGNSPWRPFDREKDLQVPGRSIGPGPTTDQSLACRFRPASS